MGIDNHAVLSPAHRRNQNPLSPSASLFRKSSTFPREDQDHSWMGLFRRHRFLLLTLALLAFLCSVYLYFAIKLGAENCSGLSPKEEALCRLKNPKVKTSHNHRASRGLLSFQEATIKEPWSQNNAQQTTAAFSWMEFLIEENSIQSLLSLGCAGRDLTHFLLNHLSMSLSSIGCKEENLLKGRFFELPPNSLHLEVPDSSWLFDLIVCENCTTTDLTTDANNLWLVDRLLRRNGFFVWISDTLTLPKFNDAILSCASGESHGWVCLSRINDMVLWQKV